MRLEVKKQLLEILQAIIFVVTLGLLVEPYCVSIGLDEFKAHTITIICFLAVLYNDLLNGIMKLIIKKGK